MTATTNTDTTNTDTDTNTNGKAPAALTAVAAISRITKILDQLSEGDKKRVLAFINVTE